MSPNPNQPIVISGPSGSGKSTLTNRLLSKYPNKFSFSISHTTRAPRGAEQNGKEYHFVSREEFQSLIESGGFIEHAQFGSNLYGTSFKAVEEISKGGKVAVLDIEMEGVKSVKKSHLQPRYLFVQPPDMETLEKRLRGRGTDKEEAIQERLAQAKNELEFAKQPGVHDKVIVNDDLERAWGEFVAFCVPGEDA